LQQQNADGLQQQNEDALAEFGWGVDLLRQAPDLGSDYVHRTICERLHDAKRLDKAFEQCTLAAERAPQRAENQISLASVLIDRDDLKNALQAADAALRVAPKSPRVHEVLARVHEKYGHQDQAIAEYRAAIRFAPEEATFHNEIGNILYGQKKFAEATKAYRAALKLTPGEAVIHTNLAVALAEQGDQSVEVIAEYRKAIEISRSTLATPPFGTSSEISSAKMADSMKPSLNTSGLSKSIPDRSSFSMILPEL